jgi:hypothetical protein
LIPVALKNDPPGNMARSLIVAARAVTAGNAVVVGAVAAVAGVDSTPSNRVAAPSATPRRGRFPAMSASTRATQCQAPSLRFTVHQDRPERQGPQQAEAALERLQILLADLGLEPKAAKTRIVHLQVGGEGLDFLGFHHRLVRSKGKVGKRDITFLARWPSRRAMQHARDRIRELTARSRLLLPVEEIVADLNRFLRGWTAYLRYGNSARHFAKIRNHAVFRLAGIIAKRHDRSRAFGRHVIAFVSPNQLGLVTLHGIVLAPRPFRAWNPVRERPNAGGERRR